MADDEMVALSERLIPLLKEYDLPKVIEALSWHLMGAVNLASKATTINRELHIALVCRGKDLLDKRRHRENLRKVLSFLAYLVAVYAAYQTSPRPYLLQSSGLSKAGMPGSLKAVTKAPATAFATSS